MLPVKPISLIIVSTHMDMPHACLSSMSPEINGMLHATYPKWVRLNDGGPIHFRNHDVCGLPPLNQLDDIVVDKSYSSVRERERNLSRKHTPIHENRLDMDAFSDGHKYGVPKLPNTVIRSFQTWDLVGFWPFKYVVWAMKIIQAMGEERLFQCNVVVCCCHPFNLVK